MYNCNINSFSGHCLLSEYGRHMGVLDNCQFEYSHDDCIVINGVDWNISHCAIGYTKNGNGVVLGQPTNRISNSDIYFNRRNGIVLKIMQLTVILQVMLLIAMVSMELLF